MSTLQSVDEIAPKSVLRYRPMAGTDGGTRRGQRSVVTSAAIPTIKRASRPRPVEADDEVAEWRRIGDDETEDERPHTAIPARRTSANIPGPAPAKIVPRPPAAQKAGSTGKRSGLRAHPLLYLGIGMVAMLVLWIVAIFFINWVGNTLDDIHYGRPRTFQIDQVVGHNDTYTPSHFIAINLNRHIEIIEFPGGDSTHARIYLGPQLYDTNDDLVPVTLSFVDVNGDKRPDMLIHFKGSVVVFINDQGGFRAVRPEERHQVEQFLQQHGL